MLLALQAQRTETLERAIWLPPSLAATKTAETAQKNSKSSSKYLIILGDRLGGSRAHPQAAIHESSGRDCRNGQDVDVLNTLESSAHGRARQTAPPGIPAKEALALHLKGDHVPGGDRIFVRSHYGVTSCCQITYGIQRFIA